ncbi:MAG: UDP-N-acetylmuramoyl-L-alanine--D-glutamate ligase [Treponema sp.]|jgi:UDP-N-acetylmuramoylalanine--D-glutamate ligase|nr:UDP-N-acetylmuramoyl-L-alanine--D-glutamate ligase [Treponema sp.]
MDYSGIKVLIMGLGLHGGGLESARFLLKRGAEITVTDLRDEKILTPSIEQLDEACRKLGQKPVRYILGRHEIEDFKNNDIVIKNPGVRPDSPFLQAAKQTETDISLFLSESPARLFAVTGTKGKSCTASALHRILDNAHNSLKTQNGKAFLGGNITVSPLTFIDELGEDDDVVLELSSFQLGDLKDKKNKDGGALLKPAAAVITSIMSDHLDRYVSMAEYVDDKKNIYRGQDSNCVTVAGDDSWGKSFRDETNGRPLVYSHRPLAEGQSGGWLDNGCGLARLSGWDGVSGETVELVPQRLLIPGEHQKLNLIAAALAVYGYGNVKRNDIQRIDTQIIKEALADFRGIEHRLEFFHEADGVRFFNDSAATIPEAAAACIEALSQQAPLVLVTGGTDKNLDFSPLVKAASKAKAIILLAGSGSEKLMPLLGEAGVSYSGPFDDLDKAVHCVLENCTRLKNSGYECVNAALSPGCASFEMFLNEFDRGRKWKEAVLRLS